MKIKITRAGVKNASNVFVACFLILTLIGCDAFVRKFTRNKPKQENLPQDQMVLAPQEYKNTQMPKEDSYRQYFLFWESWQSELIDSLQEKRSQKKQIDCIEEALKNLQEAQKLLNTDMQKKLDIYILQLKNLQSQITNDLYGNNLTNNLQAAEGIKRRVSGAFSYSKVKDSLK